MKFSEQLVIAISNPKKYKDILKLSRRSFVKYVIITVLLLSTITFVIPGAATITGFGGFEKLFETNLKTFKYEKGVASLDKVFKMNINGTTVIIDTSEKEVSAKQMKNDGTYIAISSERVIVASSVSGNVVKVADYRLYDFFPFDIDKDRLIEFIPAIYMYLALTFLMKGVFYFAEYAFYALFLAIILNIMKKNHSYNISYKSLFVICFLAQTLMMFVNAINEAVAIAPSYIVNLIGLFYTVRMATIGVLSTIESSK